MGSTCFVFQFLDLMTDALHQNEDFVSVTELSLTIYQCKCMWSKTILASQ